MDGRSLIRGSIVGLMAPIVLLLANAKASASCGDYVHILPNGISADGQPPAHPKAPCHGPNCQDAPRHPPTPSPTVTVNAPPHDAVLANCATIEAAGTERWPSESFPVPHHVPSAIFHPPRS